MSQPAADSAAPAQAQVTIEERWDDEHKQNYYLNTVTGESAWSREEVEAMAARPADPDLDPAPAPAPAPDPEAARALRREEKLLVAQKLLPTQTALFRLQLLACHRLVARHARLTGANPLTGELLFAPPRKPDAAHVKKVSALYAESQRRKDADGHALAAAEAAAAAAAAAQRAQGVAAGAVRVATARAEAADANAAIAQVRGHF